MPLIIPEYQDSPANERRTVDNQDGKDGSAEQTHGFRTASQGTTQLDVIPRLATSRSISGIRHLLRKQRNSPSTPTAPSSSTPIPRLKTNSLISSTTEPAGIEQRHHICSSALRLTTRTRILIMRKYSISPDHCEKCCDSWHSGLIHRKRSRKSRRTAQFPAPSSPLTPSIPGSARPVNAPPVFKVPTNNLKHYQ